MKQTPPAWIKDSLNAIRARMSLAPIDNPVYGFWAPVVRNVDGKFRLYYSVIVDNYIKTGLPNTTANFDNSWTERAFIGLMESTNPASNVWVDKGYVISSVSDRTSYARASTSDWSGYFKWNAIDPTYIVTPEGEHWLIYGSWHSGIPAVKLNPETFFNGFFDFVNYIIKRGFTHLNKPFCEVCNAFTVFIIELAQHAFSYKYDIMAYLPFIE